MEKLIIREKISTYDTDKYATVDYNSLIEEGLKLREKIKKEISEYNDQVDIEIELCKGENTYLLLNKEVSDNIDEVEDKNSEPLDSDIPHYEYNPTDYTMYNEYNSKNQYYSENSLFKKYGFVKDNIYPIHKYAYILEFKDERLSNIKPYMVEKVLFPGIGKTGVEIIFRNLLVDKGITTSKILLDYMKESQNGEKCNFDFNLKIIDTLTEETVINYEVTIYEEYRDNFLISFGEFTYNESDINQVSLVINGYKLNIF